MCQAVEQGWSTQFWQQQEQQDACCHPCLPALRSVLPLGSAVQGLANVIWGLGKMGAKVTHEVRGSETGTTPRIHRPCSCVWVKCPAPVADAHAAHATDALTTPAVPAAFRPTGAPDGAAAVRRDAGTADARAAQGCVPGGGVGTVGVAGHVACCALSSDAAAAAAGLLKYRLSAAVMQHHTNPRCTVAHPTAGNFSAQNISNLLHGLVNLAIHPSVRPLGLAMPQCRVSGGHACSQLVCGVRSTRCQCRSLFVQRVLVAPVCTCAPVSPVPRLSLGAAGAPVCACACHRQHAAALWAPGAAWPKGRPSSFDACGPGSWCQDQSADRQCVFFNMWQCIRQCIKQHLPYLPHCRACQELTNTAWALSQMQRSGVPFTPDVQASRPSELQLACCAGGRALQNAFLCCTVSCTWMASGPLTDVLTNSWPSPDAAGPHPRRGVGAAGRPQLAGACQAADRVQPSQRVSVVNERCCPAAVVARAAIRAASVGALPVLVSGWQCYQPLRLAQWY